MDIPAYEEHLKQMKINMYLAGIPYGHQRINFRYYILLFLLVMMLVAETSYFVSRISSENFLELTQLAPCMCIGWLSILKMLAITMKRRGIFELAENLGKLYESILEDSNKKNLAKPNLVLLNFLMKYFFVLNVVLISVYNFSTLIVILYHYISTKEVVFELPYAVLLPFSTDAWFPWSVVYIISVINGFICVLYFTTVDGLYFILTSHICVNFSIISDMIENLEKSNVNCLSDIVRSHQYILKLAEDLEDIFTAPNLFNVMVGSLEICALGFNLTLAWAPCKLSWTSENPPGSLWQLKFGTWRQIPGCILFLLSVILQILMMSVFGENIIQESLKVGDAAFVCKWYDMDQKSKKTILTIMIRSLKPQRLTAYKFSVISYASFTKIISTSWSYFTILKTVYTPPEAVHN